MAISVGNTASSGDQLAQTSVTLSLDNNKQDVIVCVMTREATDTVTISSATYAGVTMTQDRDQLYTEVGSALHARIFRLQGAATGANDIVITFSAAMTISGVIGVAVGGLAQTGQPDVVGGDDDPFESSTQPSVTVTTVKPATILIGCFYHKRDGAITQGSGQTLIADIDINGGGDNAGASYKIVSASGSNSLSWTADNGEDDWTSSLAAYAEESYQIIAVTSSTSSLGSAANASLPKPATVNDNDTLVAIIGGKATTTGTFNAGTAWTKYELTTATGNDVYSGIFYRTVPLASALTGTFTFTGTAAQTYAAFIASLSGVNQTSPEDISFASKWANLQNAIVSTTPSYTTVTPGAFGYVGYVVNIDTSTTQAPGLFGTSNVDDLNGILNVYSGIFNTAGVATGTTSLSGISANQESQSGVFLFRPATLVATSPGFTSTLTKSLIRLIANTLTSSKVVNKTSSLVKSLITVRANSISASRSTIATTTSAVVRMQTGSLTASKQVNKTAQLTTAFIKVLTNQTVGEIPVGVDTKTATVTGSLVSVITNTTTASKSVSKTATITTALVKVNVGQTTASNQSNKTSSLSKQVVSIITNTLTASKGQSKTATLTQAIIKVSVNNVTVSIVSVKTANLTKALINVITGNIVASIPGGASGITVTILLRSGYETKLLVNSRIDKFMNAESEYSTQFVNNSRIDKFINADDYLNKTDSISNRMVLKSKVPNV